MKIPLNVLMVLYDTMQDSLRIGDHGDIWRWRQETRVKILDAILDEMSKVNLMVVENDKTD